MEEDRQFSWTNFFIKGIIVIIFILFTVWLLSLSNRGINDSLDVLTDNIFADNVDRMKEAGIGYYTNERLPQKIGGVASISLEDMYKKKLVLDIKDKHGNACSAKNSYVSVEKFNGYEYHMKVYLECGEEHDYINVILGCYDYCDSEVCEKKDAVDTKELEYEYSKVINGGYWTDYGNWSEWSKVYVNKTNYRDVETKTEKEKYEYDKTVTKDKYVDLDMNCPEGYYREGNACYKPANRVEYTSPNKCPREYNGGVLVSQDGFTCKYSNSETSYANPNRCPSTSNGYTLDSQDGFTCYYIKTITGGTTNPVCSSSYQGYSFNSRNGFTCNYSKNITYSYQSPYTVSKQVPIGKRLVSDCDGCKAHWVTQYETQYETKYETKYGTKTDYKSTSATCPSGYDKSGNTCIAANKTDYMTSYVGCPSGYSKSGNSCIKTNVSYTYSNTTCPSGYDKLGNRCYKDTSILLKEDLIKTCPSGYKKTDDGSKCYKKVSSVEHVTGERNVTYYRYRLREYIGGTVDYKWSTSNNDKKLIDAGYKLTGRTRELGGK